MRLVTVRLPNGELEVLATSLLDETLHPTAEFEHFTLCVAKLRFEIIPFLIAILRGHCTPPRTNPTVQM